MCIGGLESENESESESERRGGGEGGAFRTPLWQRLSIGVD